MDVIRSVDTHTLESDMVVNYILLSSWSLKCFHASTTPCSLGADVELVVQINSIWGFWHPRRTLLSEVGGDN